MIHHDDMEMFLRTPDNNSKSENISQVELFIERNAKIGTAGPITTVVNLLKTILGTGMLALPYALNGLGILPGVILLALCAYFARHGLIVYSRCGMRAGIAHDDGIGVLCKLVDRRLGPLINFALFAMCVGSAISYLCLIGDLLPELLPFKVSRNLCNAAVTVFILFPLSFIRNMNRLQYTSVLGLLGVLYALVLSICLLKIEGMNLTDLPLLRPQVLQLSNVNSIVFVFTCHQSFLILKSESKDQSESFMRKIVTVCISTSGIIYMLFAVCSCLVFGKNLSSNILQNYGTENYFLIAKWLYVVLAVTSFPLMTSPARTVLLHQFPTVSFETATTLICILTLVASMFSTNLNTITEWIGILSGIPICFIIPFILEYRLFPEHKLKHLLPSLLMLIFGLVCLLFSFK